jgi:hypothetical protein
MSTLDARNSERYQRIIRLVHEQAASRKMGSAIHKAKWDYDPRINAERLIARPRNWYRTRKLW